MRSLTWRFGPLMVAAAILARSANPPATAQEQARPDTQQQPPVFRSGANLVRVDVSVLDRRGNPVPTLTAGDFELEEDGHRQNIQSFKFLQASGRPEAGDELSLAIRSPSHAAAEAARDDVRVFLIFWDEYHIDQFESAIRARDSLAKVVATAFGPTDLVAIMDPLTPVDAIRFTRDWSELGLAIKKLRGRLGVFVPTRSAAEEAQLARGGDVRRLRAEVSLSALKAAAVFLGTLREGRKSIIFISQGLRALGRDQESLLGDAVRAANESNTAIYTADPRGLNARGGTDSLWILAENTGAKAILNTNSLDAPLRQVVKDASAFYLLGYSSSRNPADGRFHQIKVRVKSPGLEVRARKGYWAPSLSAMTRAREAAAAAEPPTEIARALERLTPSMARRTVDVWTGASRGEDGRPLLRVTWSRRAAADERTPGAAAVSVNALDASGRSFFDGRVGDGGVSFPVDAGVVQLQIAVLDAADEIVDSERRTVTVPDFNKNPFAWSSPVILRARTPLDLKALNTNLDAAPFAGNEFSRGDRLLVRVALYGDDRREAKVSARVTNRRGVELATLPVSLLAGTSGTYQLDVPVSSLAPGDFVIRVEATRGDERADALVAIRVVG